jgi:hypothetical protein
MFHGGDLAAHFVEEFEHHRDRLAVLAFQLLNRRQARFNFFQTPGVRLQPAEVIAQAVGSFFQAEVGILQMFAQALK